MPFEVEVRSFISDAQFQELLDRFMKEGDYVGVDRQETWYFDAPYDVRIQRNDSHAKIWMKKGKMHDESREEIEVKTSREDFPVLQALFAGLGYGVNIKWFRTRHSFDWQGIRVTIDDTLGYGRVIELEKLVEESEKDRALEQLKRTMNGLGIAITPREEFDARYGWYKEHWKEAVAV